jgi:hypothetical protein
LAGAAAGFGAGVAGVEFFAGAGIPAAGFLAMFHLP